MSRRHGAEIAALVTLLCSEPDVELVALGDGNYGVAPGATRRLCPITSATCRQLCAEGLLVEHSPGRFTASGVARAWLRRRASPENAFRKQHGEVVEMRMADGGDRHVLVDLDESPLGSLARRAGKNGEPWLSADLAAAGERLRRDFEIGQLQPRITANWSASVSDGRRTGDGSGLKDLTDMALAARLRLDRAMRDVGPEFSGVLVDICCFLKGLETVERERQWPARSAKLVLRMGLTSLARHYGLTSTATGRTTGKFQHWGADDYRPAIS